MLLGGTFKIGVDEVYDSILGFLEGSLRILVPQGALRDFRISSMILIAQGLVL